MALAFEKEIEWYMDERPAMWHQTTGLGEWEPRPGRGFAFDKWAAKVGRVVLRALLRMGLVVLILYFFWFVCFRVLAGPGL